MKEQKALDPETIRTALHRERDELMNASDVSAEDRQPVELDQQSVGRLSRMDALQVQAMANAVDVRRKARLRLIDAALERLDDGDYGECSECGEEISANRLALDPTAMRCVNCAN